jgi:hypothetical protein
MADPVAGSLVTVSLGRAAGRRELPDPVVPGAVGRPSKILAPEVLVRAGREVVDPTAGVPLERRAQAMIVLMGGGPRVTGNRTSRSTGLQYAL